MEKNKPTKYDVLSRITLIPVYRLKSDDKGEYITKSGTLQAMDKWAEIYHKEKLREELKEFIQIARKGTTIVSGLTGAMSWRFDVDSENKVIDEYLKQKQ